MGSAARHAFGDRYSPGAFKVIKGTNGQRTLILLSVVACLFAISVWFLPHVSERRLN